MSVKKISYLNKNFSEIKQGLIDYTREYYPEIANDLDDASIGQWFIELMSAVGDNLSFYIDKVYNETNIDSAQMKNSVYSLARSNGLRVPGPKASIVELTFSCQLPPDGSNNDSSTLGYPSYTFAPIIKKGSRVSSNSGIYFETTEDVDFSEQFNSYGEPNRTVIPLSNPNRGVMAYEVRKTVTAVAGYSKIYKLLVTPAMAKPFMEIVIPDRNVLNVESIILKDGGAYANEPCIEEFMMQSEFLSAKNESDNSTSVDTYRFFEVDSLSQNYMWGDDVTYTSKTVSDTTYEEAEPQVIQYNYYTGGPNQNVPMYSIAKGTWKPVTQKFITEYTDNGYLKIIFGGGDMVGQDISTSGMTFTAQNQISHMVYNNNLGRRPKVGMTMFIRYRVGGGSASNVPANTINTLQSIDAVNRTQPDTNNKTIASSILASIRVNNESPSVSGKDAPNVDEIRALIKYNNGAMNRCVTVKDYEVMLMKMPPRYGTPFRLKATEENNKVMIYVLMVDNNGNLTGDTPSTLINNMQNYLAGYRSINDYVEIKPGRIINISMTFDLYVDKNYNTANVQTSVINTITDYFDISKNNIGEYIYVTDIIRKVMNVDGVLSFTNLVIYNEFGSRYSSTKTSQVTLDITETEGGSDLSNAAPIDLSSSNYILVSEPDEMFEIKYPDSDIRCRVIMM